MEAIIFIGIQATGKSSFYKRNFFNSHVRISLDLLNTRNKQNLFLETCLNTQSKFVVDNTNPFKEEREEIIRRAKERKYKVVGYYFSSSIADALDRNSKRIGKERIPEIGVRSCYRNLSIPTFDEGFDELYYVELDKDDFIVREWNNEV